MNNVSPHRKWNLTSPGMKAQYSLVTRNNLTQQKSQRSKRNLFKHRQGMFVMQWNISLLSWSNWLHTTCQTIGSHVKRFPGQLRCHATVIIVLHINSLRSFRHTGLTMLTRCTPATFRDAFNPHCVKDHQEVKFLAQNQTHNVQRLVFPVHPHPNPLLSPHSKQV